MEAQLGLSRACSTVDDAEELANMQQTAAEAGTCCAAASLGRKPSKTDWELMRRRPQHLAEEKLEKGSFEGSLATENLESAAAENEREGAASVAPLGSQTKTKAAERGWHSCWHVLTQGQQNELRLVTEILQLEEELKAKRAALDDRSVEVSRADKLARESVAELSGSWKQDSAMAGTVANHGMPAGAGYPRAKGCFGPR